jgi:3-methyladenine DNA glycosylase AlkD
VRKRSVDELVAATEERMRAAADPRHETGVRNFFIEPVDPWGVRSADLKPIEQMVYRELKRMTLAERNKYCDKLWKRGKLEEGALVCHVYRRFASECRTCEFKLFERWIDRYVNNWAHCDGISAWLLAACIGNEPSLKAELFGWTRSGNRWKRRATAVSLLQEAKKGRSSEDIFRIAGELAHDEDTMVQKGVGWLLKEAYPKRPEAVVEFLAETQPPRLVVRYAAEKMTARDKARFGLGSLRAGAAV